MQSQIKERINTDDPVNSITDRILDAAFRIHRQYGPGLLESVYEKILLYELTKIENRRKNTAASPGTNPDLHEIVGYTHRIDYQFQCAVAERRH